MGIHSNINAREFKPVSNVGSKWRKKYIRAIDEDGCPFLKEVGVIDTQAEINKWKDSVDINRIIEDVTHGSVNFSVLDATQVANLLRLPNSGQYVDVSGMPKSLIEAYQVLDNAKNLYDSLDESVKATYGSYADFLAASDYSAFIPKKVSEEVNADA